jgi:hypothetical protein
MERPAARSEERKGEVVEWCAVVQGWRRRENTKE